MHGGQVRGHSDAWDMMNRAGLFPTREWWWKGPETGPTSQGKWERETPPPILFPPRPVFLGPSFLHALCCHTQLALNVEFIYLLFLYSSLQFSLSLSENNGLVNFLSKTLKAWF